MLALLLYILPCWTHEIETLKVLPHVYVAT